MVAYFLEKYSSGRRGAPAKGVGRVTGAEVQIFSSPPKRQRYIFVSLFFLLAEMNLNFISVGYLVRDAVRLHESIYSLAEWLVAPIHSVVK